MDTVKTALNFLLPKVLRKIQTDRAEGIVVTPLWKNQMFWPMLVNMLTANPVLLSHGDALLTQPDDKTPKHPLQKKMSLVVCRVSGKGGKHQDFLATLPPSSCHHGDKERKQKYNVYIQNGSGTHVRGRWIPFHPL
ncbi:hypothetical protein ACOMHN_009246 [Nucella lapillus]